MQPNITLSSPEKAPEWAFRFLKSTALAGVLWCSIALTAIYLVFYGTRGGFWNATLFLGCAAIWLPSLAVLWRQYALRQWAVGVATIAAWATVAVMATFVVAHCNIEGWSVFPLFLAPIAVTIVVAVAMTAACKAVWKELHTGF